jgi:hypothetical protein
VPRSLLVRGIVVALLAVGCGGDEALSREEYVAKLNAMCEDFGEREDEIGEPQTVADLVEKGPQILEAFDKAILNQVEELRAPGEIADEADRLVVLASRQHDVLAGLVDAAREGDLERVQELAARNERVNGEASALARRLGAESCTSEEPA